MGMGIEAILIHEWEWELIHYFSQLMGMGINSSFFVNGPKSGWDDTSATQSPVVNLGTLT